MYIVIGYNIYKSENPYEFKLFDFKNGDFIKPTDSYSDIIQLVWDREFQNLSDAIKLVYIIAKNDIEYQSMQTKSHAHAICDNIQNLKQIKPELFI